MPVSTQPSTLIRALGAHGDALSARSIARSCSGSFWDERFGERGTARIEEDSKHHITHLQCALQYSAPSILTKYAMWLQEVLTVRGMCSLHLAEHFDSLAQAIVDESLPDADVAEIYLRAAIEALKYDSGRAGAVEAVTEPLTTAMLHAIESESADEIGHGPYLRRDIKYLLSYMTDAVKLERPQVFSQYAVWIDGYFSRRNRPPAYLREIVRVLDVCLDAVSQEVRQACQSSVSETRSSLEVASG